MSAPAPESARIRTMSAELLPKEVLSALRSCARPEEALAILAQTSWRPFVDRARARRFGAKAVLEAARLRFADGCRRATSLYPPSGRRALELVLARFDLSNLQALLRAKGAGQPESEALEAVVPAGLLGEEGLASLVRAPTLESLAGRLEALNPAYGAIAAGALRAYRASGRWADAEAELERGFYEWLDAALDEEGAAAEPVRELARREIDVVDVAAVLRLDGAPAGSISAARRAEVEAALRLECFRRASRALGREPRGVEPAIAYVAELAAETAAVRRIALALARRALEEERAATASAPG